jgi:hypothetical protein
MRSILPAFVLLCFATVVQAQSSDFPVGARSAGMGHASVTLTDLWATHHNQAALAGLQQAGAAVFYENRFLLPDLNLQAATFAIPAGKAGTFGISYARFGNALYNQSRYGLAYGKQLFPFLSVGLQLNYMNTHLAEGYGDRHSFVAEIGLLSQITPKFRAGFHAYNLTRTVLEDATDERVPMNFRLGLQYDFSKKVLVAVEVEKDLILDPNVKVGIEYFPVEQFAIRLGMGTLPLHMDIGFGLRLKHFHFDIAGSIHPVLGFSPKASLAYMFNVKKKG